MYLEDKKELVYIAYDDKGDWTVRTSKNGKKPKTVFEDVSRFFVTSHGNIAAVVYEGTGEGRHKNLYINNTKKPIAENVENIASLSSWEDYSYMAF